MYPSPVKVSATCKVLISKDVFAEIVLKKGGMDKSHIQNIERFAFYEVAKTAYCIIATGESALYANIMLQKGVVTD